MVNSPITTAARGCGVQEARLDRDTKSWGTGKPQFETEGSCEMAIIKQRVFLKQKA